MVRKVDIAPPTDQERLEQLRAEARRPHPSRMSEPMRPTKPTASDFDTNLDFRNRLADEGLFPTPISGKDTLPRRFNQPGYVPVWTPNPNERGGYSVYGFPQVVSADDAVMGMAPPSDSLDVHPYLMPFTVNRELLPPPSLNVEDRRSTAQTIQNLLAADPRTQGSWLMPDWRTPTARAMERSPGDTTTQEGTAERHFDPYLLQPDLSQMPTRVRVGDPNARQFELPGSVPADVPVPNVSTGRWGDQASLQGGGGSNTLAGGGGETLNMGPNEEAVSSANYTSPVGGSQAGTKLWDANAVPYSGGNAYSRSFGGPRGGQRHTAVDIPGRVGDPILAVDNGVIRGARNQAGGYGYLVDIEYPDGTVHRAAHLDSMPPVKVGDQVPAGTVIGYLGHSGNAKASFPHAHYEVINKAYYDASPTLTDKRGNVIGNAPPGRASRGELAAGRQDPRLYFAGYRGPDAVARFQREAQTAGYYDGEIDGIAGPGTEGALEQMASAGAIGGLVGSAGPTPQVPTAPQDAQSAIASLIDPTGGTLTPSVPAGAEAYAPFLPPAAPTPSPPASSPAPSRDFDFAAGPGPTFTPPPISRSPGPGGALGVDLGMQPAGMPPPPSRPGTFDWLGGGAPPAAMVPPPGISPLRPAFGGPGDRRPQPPTPPSRAQGIPLPPMRPGNFDYMGGGAPDAAGLPLPPSRPMGMPPSAPQSPVDAISGSPGPMSLEALLSPRRAPQAARDAVLAGLQDDTTSLPWRERIGQEGPVRPRTRMENAEMNLWRPDFSLAAGGNLGTPETQLSLDRPPAPPPGGGPDFASANPSPMLPPSWSPATSFPPSYGETLAMGPAEEPVSGVPEFDRGRFDDAFGVPPIPEVAGRRVLSAEETAAIQQEMAQGSPIDLRPQTGDPAAPSIDPAAAAAHMPSRPPPPQQSIVKAAAAAAAAPAKTTSRPPFLERAFQSAFGINPNGFFAGGGFFGGPPASFTPYANPIMNTGMGGTIRTSGKTPSGTPWSTGTSNALGGSNALRWTGSGGQTITAYTDPVTGTTFHSFS